MSALEAQCGWFLMAQKDREEFAATLAYLGVMTSLEATQLALAPLRDPWNPQSRQK